VRLNASIITVEETHNSFIRLRKVTRLLAFANLPLLLPLD